MNTVHGHNALVEVVGKHVDFGGGGANQICHSVSITNYGKP